jgi:hypothetical protein
MKEHFFYKNLMNNVSGILCSRDIMTTKKLREVSDRDTKHTAVVTKSKNLEGKS